MPPAPLIPYLGYASLLPSPVSQREKQRRGRRASLLLATLAACCCLLLLLIVAGRAGRGGEEGGKEHFKEGATTAATTKTTAAASSPLSPLLTPLQRRLLLPQQPTHNLSADGGIGRVERVAAARLLVVEAELSLRRKQRKGKEEEESSSGRRRRQRRRQERGGGDRRVPNPSSSSSPSPPFPSPPIVPRHLRRRRPASDPNYLAACVVLRDQNDDLPEFVAWHAALGVGTFYLYDDRSATPVTPELARSLLPSSSSSSSSSSASSASSDVSIHVTRLSEEAVRAHPAKRAQMAAYDDCALARRGSHSWLAFLDVDEFVTISDDDDAESDGGEESDAVAAPLLSSSSLSDGFKKAAAAAAANNNNKKLLLLPSLPALLSRFEAANAAAVLLHWRVFGSSGRNSSKPSNLSTPEAFTSCLGPRERENAHVKTIARTDFLDVAEPCLGPHHFSFWDLGAAVDELEKRQVEEEEDDDAEEEEGEEAEKEEPLPWWASTTEHVLSPSAPYPVDVRGRRLDGPVAADFETATPPFSPAFLAHYAIKSREDYRKKMERGSAMGNRKTWEFFEGVDSRAKEEEEEREEEEGGGKGGGGKGGGGGECREARRLARKMREAGALALPT